MKPLNRRGFATIIALATVAVVTTALAGLSALFAVEASRTASARSSAQLQQLLLAGAADASTRAAAWPASGQPAPKWDLSLPPSLAQRGGSLTANAAFTDPARGGVNVILHAQFAGRSASQTLHLLHDPAGWRIDSAILQSKP